MTRFNRFAGFLWSLFILTVIGVTIGAVLFYTVLDTAPPIRFVDEQTFGTDPYEGVPSGRPGDRLSIIRKFYQDRNIPGTVSQKFQCVDAHGDYEIVKTLVDVPESFPASPDMYVKSFSFVVPNAPGRKCFYDVSITYRLNRFSDPVSIKLAPVYFEVLP